MKKKYINEEEIQVSITIKMTHFRILDSDKHPQCSDDSS